MAETDTVVLDCRMPMDGRAGDDVSVRLHGATLTVNWRRADDDVVLTLRVAAPRAYEGAVTAATRLHVLNARGNRTRVSMPTCSVATLDMPAATRRWTMRGLARDLAAQRELITGGSMALSCALTVDGLFAVKQRLAHRICAAHGVDDADLGVAFGRLADVLGVTDAIVADREAAAREAAERAAAVARAEREAVERAEAERAATAARRAAAQAAAQAAAPAAEQAAEQPGAPAAEQAAPCPVCMERARDCVLVPCRHVLCAQCAARVRPAGCPVCRASIAETMRVFL